MHRFSLLTTAVATSLLFACSGHDSTPLTVQDRAILEVEDFSGSNGTALLEWLLIDLDSDYGAAATLVARDSAHWSDDGLPSLTYDIDFPVAGQFGLSLRARQDSRFNASPVYLNFGADEGDVIWSITGFDDQWSWYDTDHNGQTMRIEVNTPGVHQLRISSGAEGLLLDQLDIQRVGWGDDTGNESGNESVNEAAPPQDTNNTTPDTTAPAPQAPDTNQPPSALISADATISVGAPLGLSVTATDDGAPHGGIYYYWTKTAGPGNGSFSALQTSISSVTFDQPGNYTVQATVSDGELYTNVWHNVTVTAPATGDQTDTQADNSQSASATENIPAAYRWHQLTTSGRVTARHETGGVVVNNKLYVIGGRGDRPVEVYDPQDNTWRRVSTAPLEMHHFQPVAVGNKIYVVGAFTCCYPRENIIDNVYIFDTDTNRWSQGPALPANRKRGSAGAVVHNDRIYLLGGNTRGHSGGAVNWFDEFDPATGRWTTLNNAPDARDHVTIAVVNAKLVVAGGRRTNTPVPFANTVSRTNVYDFNTGRWSTAADIPTQRAGTMTVAMGDEVIVIGGESTASTQAHRNVEAFNVNTRQWRSLDQLNTARHGGAAGILNGKIHVVSGNTIRGGGQETSSHEVLR